MVEEQKKLFNNNCMASITYSKEDRIIKAFVEAISGDSYANYIKLMAGKFFPKGTKLASKVYVPFVAIIFGLFVAIFTIFWYLILVPLLFVFTILPVFIFVYVVGVVLGLMPFLLKDPSPKAKKPLSKTYKGIDKLLIPFREWSMSGLSSALLARDFGKRPSEWFNSINTSGSTDSHIIRLTTLFIANLLSYPIYCFILFPIDFVVIYLGIIVIGVIAFILWAILSLSKSLVTTVAGLFK